MIKDEEDRLVFERRLSNNLSQTLKVFQPYQSTLCGITIECSLNWYWLVDGLQAHGYQVKLVNKCAIELVDIFGNDTVTIVEVAV